ncbi:universal stress protein [Tsukamurella sp. 8F]|uniref:universal stress protein n=1 Tax=unclassified Tsukamurella TaxID=2633480 RepID=UPI0023B8E5FD|nr:MULTISPECIES: universal stress protein [unclassified Tsukamurella]MDF0529655.1 universal stress protein [Tsukamurella sp. 8J]MDF0585940.1 universal stress protein [Tsukamurella sp. 8F]
MRLLVGYLATDTGADGVALGIRLARTLDAELDIAMIVPPQPPGAPGYEDVVIAAARGWLTQAASTVPDDVAVTIHVAVDESFAEGLIRLAEELDVDALVVGAAGDGLLDRHSIGSVTSDLLHSSPVPLALAPRGTRNSPASKIRQVTCAVGTRPGASLALDTAVRSARATDIPLRLMSLIALDPLPAGIPDPDDVRANRARAHAKSLLESAKALLPDGFPVGLEVAEGATVEGAVAALDWHDGDILVVGSSRLARQRRLFLGSTAAKMLRVLQVPMVVTPNKEV